MSPTHRQQLASWRAKPLVYSPDGVGSLVEQQHVGQQAPDDREMIHRHSGRSAGTLQAGREGELVEIALQRACAGLQ